MRCAAARLALALALALSACGSPGNSSADEDGRPNVDASEASEGSASASAGASDEASSSDTSESASATDVTASETSDGSSETGEEIPLVLGCAGECLIYCAHEAGAASTEFDECLIGCMEIEDTVTIDCQNYAHIFGACAEFYGLHACQEEVPDIEGGACAEQWVPVVQHCGID